MDSPARPKTASSTSFYTNEEDGTGWCTSPQKYTPKMPCCIVIVMQKEDGAKIHPKKAVLHRVSTCRRTLAPVRALCSTAYFATSEPRKCHHAFCPMQHGFCGVFLGDGLSWCRALQVQKKVPFLMVPPFRHIKIK